MISWLAVSSAWPPSCLSMSSKRRASFHGRLHYRERKVEQLLDILSCVCFKSLHGRGIREVCVTPQNFPLNVRTQKSTVPMGFQPGGSAHPQRPELLELRKPCSFFVCELWALGVDMAVEVSMCPAELRPQCLLTVPRSPPFPSILF